MGGKRNEIISEAHPATNADVHWLTVVGARQNNLRNVTVEIPLGRFVCVTGVSGSGKSSLVNDIVRETLARDLNGATKVNPGLHDSIEGLEHLDKVIDIDQSPIGRTPRSNPATYIKVFDLIRELYAKLPDSKVRGYKPGRFSFNVHTGKAGGGRCEACEGNGSNKMEMDFLADVWVICPVCNARRFNRETLQVFYKGKSIADVLDMDVQQALTHFEHIPKIAAMLRTLHDVGMDYIKLGQSSTTLSGGEAQRIKLARELVKKSTGRTLYLLDEPTTGLHFDDIRKLLAVLHGFVDAGNSVIVIEHNLDVIKTADWIIDLGPEGGAGGGRIVAAGTPERVARSKRSHTGATLQAVLNGETSKRQKVEKSKSQKVKKSKSRNAITVVGAKQHNLKDITVSVPREEMTVCCGPSGSGKSSFAIDTVYAEGQRRYVESLSAYARQFISRLQPPRVDHVHGLSPAICIEQKNTAKSPRSTVGTVTEVYDYMRILWARLGIPHCPRCKVPIGTQSSDEIVEKVLSLGEGRKVLLLAPVEPTGQETYENLLARERANGYARVRIDGVVHSLDEPVAIDGKRRHAVELVVDRVVVRRNRASRISDSVEQALSVGNGVMIARVVEDGEGTRITGSTLTVRRRGQNTAAPRGTEDSRGLKPAARDRDVRFSQHRSCEGCGRSYEELSAHHFSFNSRLGWCDACEGLGVQQGASPAAIVVHPTRSIADGAIGGWGELTPGSKLHALASALTDHIGFDLHRPWNRLTETQRLTFLQGCGDDWIDAGLDGIRFKWRGFFPAINRATRSSWQYRKRLEELVTDVPCEACSGGRLAPEPSAVRMAGFTMHEVCAWPMGRTLEWFEKLRLDPRERKIAGELIREIVSRLRFLVDVGLDYVTLHRTTATLSGGESQRIQLASQLGTGLTGVLYVLDEPTIGLHPRDNNRLIKALKRLRDLGNTLMVVEHDREVIDSADHVLDFGPGAGAAGGEITAAASPKRLRSKRASLTGQYLSFKKAIPVPANRRPVDPEPFWLDRSIHPEPRASARANVPEAENKTYGREATPLRQPDGSTHPWLTVYGAREHNLKEIDVSFPLSRFICVTGVSGSGKSTLVADILYNALAARIHRARLVPGGHERIAGIEHIDKVINVDQSAIGNSPTSNPATYTGVFDAVRELFTKLPLSKIRGYTANRFSFNRPGGRCEVCQGMGRRCIEMHFLPDVWVECESCRGSRYVPETLEVRYRGKSIADVLNLPVSDALALFVNVPAVRRMLQTLDDVGLGYMQLGQPAPTLSGGEAQRVKLAAELGRPQTGKTLYLLDEPTTGLHFDDLKKLLTVLHRLVDLGNTCICIEHNLEVIKTADWVIDLGPEAGEAGGEIVVAATPEQLAATKQSHTGRALAPVLKSGPVEERPRYDRVGVDPIRDATVRERATDVEVALSQTMDLEHDIQMPWQRDGKRWHTVEHVGRKGEPVAWDPDLLVFLVETIESLGPFAPADWNDRVRVEIRAPGKGYWFCHILTGGKDLLDMLLRVPAGTFKEQDLSTRLKLKTLDERTDLPIYGQWSRATARGEHAGWGMIRLSLRDFKDIHKRSFASFLKTAAAAYHQRFQAERADPGKREPWKVKGEEWHLSQKSITPGRPVRWRPDTLLAMIGRFRKLQPDLELLWGCQTAVRLQVPGEPQFAGKIVTNMARGLRIELRARPGSLTPTQIERLGEDVTIHHRAGHDWIAFWLRSLTQSDSKQLRDVWQRCRPASVDERLQTA